MSLGPHRRPKLLDVGERLQQALVARGLSCEAAARGLGIRSGAVVLAWINGTSLPSLPNLVRICQGLDISADWLLLGKGADHG